MELADRLFEVTYRYINAQLSVGFPRRHVYELLVLQQATLLEALRGESDSLTPLVEKATSGAKLTVEEQATVNAVFVAVMNLSHEKTGY